MRLLDLRTSDADAAPRVEPIASEAAELLRLTGVLLAPAPHEFDVGAGRIAALREQVGPELLGRADTLGRGLEGIDDTEGRSDKAFLHLSLLGALLPPPSDVTGLCELLVAEPSLPWRLMVAAHVPGLTPEAVGLRERLIADAPGVVDEARDADLGSTTPELDALVAAPPESYGQRFLGVVTDIARSVWPSVAEETMAAVERDVGFRLQQLADGRPPAEVVLEATNGFELTDEPAGRRVALLPSYWLRPWIVIGVLDGTRTEVVSSVVADRFVALPQEAPPPSLLKLFKALSDEGRLKLLRRMSTGPISLGDATELLGVAKATAHHHLSILRQAGLISLGGEGRGSRYRLRVDPADLARTGLEAYVPLPMGLTDLDGD